MKSTWIVLAVAPIAITNDDRLYGQEPASSASAAEYDGWKVFHSYCDRCHGQDATGSSFAPDLRQSVGANGMTESAFAAVLRDGRPDKGMPSFKPMITDPQLSQLYAYVQARSAGTLGAGRPKRSS